MLKLSSRWSAGAGIVAVVVGLLAMAGCGSDDTVDASKAEQGIESSSLSTSTTQITSASCPDDVKKEKDGTFTCDVKLSGGGKAEVTVTQTSDRNTFSYAFKSGSVVLPGSTVDKDDRARPRRCGDQGRNGELPGHRPGEDRHHGHLPRHHRQREAGDGELRIQRLLRDGRLVLGRGVVSALR